MLGVKNTEICIKMYEIKVKKKKKKNEKKHTQVKYTNLKNLLKYSNQVFVLCICQLKKTHVLSAFVSHSDCYQSHNLAAEVCLLVLWVIMTGVQWLQDLEGDKNELIVNMRHKHHPV